MPTLVTYCMISIDRFVRLETVKDPQHRDRKLFRRRFRVPYSFYMRLLDDPILGACSRYTDV